MKVNKKIISFILAFLTVLTVVLPIFNGTVYAASWDEYEELLNNAFSEVDESNFSWDYSNKSGKITIPLDTRIDFIEVDWNSSEVRAYNGKAYLLIKPNGRVASTEPLMVDITTSVRYKDIEYACTPKRLTSIFRSYRNRN